MEEVLRAKGGIVAAEEGGGGGGGGGREFYGLIYLK